jgi:hypothetical protein
MPIGRWFSSGKNRALLFEILQVWHIDNDFGANQQSLSISADLPGSH